MARLLDKTTLTEDEGFRVPSEIGDWVERWMETLNIDSYNKQYVISLTVDEVDDNPPEKAEEET